MARNQRFWTSDRRLFLDAAGKVVEADDPTRATLLVAAGNDLPLEQAERLGLVQPVEEKLSPKTPANKSRTAPENK